ncbi:MAG TPA: M48 family metallopeptidase [Candidatus Limnocylindria bacterium]|nr:M48 family metallopeptidase [Candidatus Limnocylindria bacterium]
MQLQWFGYYFDGQSAIRRNARIYLEPGNLRIDLDDGTMLTWPYAAIRQTQGAYAGEHVRLEHGGEPVEVLLIDDNSFLTSLHQLMPSRAGGFHNPAKRFQRFQLTIAAAGASIALVIGSYFWGIPMLATIAAPWVPVSWEEQLGQSMLEYVAPAEQRCSDPGRLAKLENLVGAMVVTQGETKYRFKIHVVNQPMFNALAAPGGHLVIFRGLLDRTENAEELAGVMAHELQHILKLHVTRSLLEYASTSFLVAAVLGDTSGIVSFGVEAAQMLAQMRFSRQHELEADEAGLQMLLAARIDPAGMIAFFEAVGKDEGQMAPALSYISTHPQTELRIARLKSLIAASAVSYQKLLPDDSWEDIKKICPAPVIPAKQ